MNAPHGTFEFRRARALAKKEVRHVLRDPFTLAMALLVPIILVAAFGVAVNLDVKNVRLAIVDQDNTQASRILKQTFTNSSYFIGKTGPWEKNPEEALASESAKAVLIIPKKFEDNIALGRQASVQILLDGTDNSIVGTILNYINGVYRSASKKLLPPTNEKQVELVPRFLFNPEQSSPWFIVPGLSVVILSILSILLTALTVAREWETGSMELLLSTPARPLEIVLGKIVPYLVMGLMGAVFVYLAARLGFGIPFAGNHFYFFVGTFLFLCNYLALGLLISAVARKQQLAMQMALISGYMPSILLSGFIFSIQNMDLGWRILTMFLPARWYMQVSRACYLKDPSIQDLLLPFGAMTLLSIVYIYAVTRKFKRTLEK